MCPGRRTKVDIASSLEIDHSDLIYRPFGLSVPQHQQWLSQIDPESSQPGRLHQTVSRKYRLRKHPVAIAVSMLCQSINHRESL